jgi:3'-phosphoadenosine 5'-phosphosulfate sulfotransferase (PAPS reductase)/FAD synthetase
MLVYKNFLTEDIIKVLREDADKKTRKGEFTPSNAFWSKDLTENIPGVVSVSHVSDNINVVLLDIINESIKHHIPPSKDIGCMHYFWHPLSGINMHTDEGYHFGATIYLNDEWDIHYGGLLLEVAKPNKDITVHLPEYNKCVINIETQWHMVTPTAFHAPIRHTIQIWGIK